MRMRVDYFMQAAAQLGQTDDADKYKQRFQDIAAAFRSAFIDADGVIKVWSATRQLVLPACRVTAAADAAKCCSCMSGAVLPIFNRDFFLGPHHSALRHCCRATPSVPTSWHWPLKCWTCPRSGRDRGSAW